MTTTEEESCQGKRFVVPAGLKCLLEEMSREVLRNQPENIYSFLANYLEEKCRKQCGPECNKDAGSGMGTMPRATNADINPTGEAMTGTTQGYAPKIDGVAPFGYGADGQPIPGPTRDAPFGYGPDGKPLAALDPRAPNGYGPDGKPLPGAACVAPYGYDKDGKPLSKPDPYAPFGYHLLDGLPVATNDPTAPFGFGPDGNPLANRDPNAPLGYNVDGQPNIYPETVSFCGDKDFAGAQQGALGQNIPGGGQGIQQQDEYCGDISSATCQDAQMQTGPAGALSNFNGQPFAGDANANSIQGIYSPNSPSQRIPQNAFSNYDQSTTSGLVPQTSLEGQIPQAQLSAGQCDGESVMFIGGPGTNLLMSYNPVGAGTQAQISQVANAVSCGVQFGPQAGMCDCAGVMQSAIECMLSRVTNILSGLILQGISNNAAPAAGNRIGLTDYVTNPCFAPQQQQLSQPQSQPQGARTGTTGDGAETTISDNILTGHPDGEAGEVEAENLGTNENIEQENADTEIPEDIEDKAGTAGVADSNEQASPEEAALAAQEACSKAATAAPSEGAMPSTNDENVSMKGDGETTPNVGAVSTTVTQASNVGISTNATPKQSQPIGQEGEEPANMGAHSTSTTTAAAQASKPGMSATGSPKQSQPIGQQCEEATNMEAPSTGTTTAGAQASKHGTSATASPKQSQPIGQQCEEAANVVALSTISAAAQASQPGMSASALPKTSQPIPQALSVASALPKASQPIPQALSVASALPKTSQPIPQALSAASTVKGAATKPRQRCIPKELWQYVPITGGGVCPGNSGPGGAEAERSAAGAPQIPVRQAGLAKLQVSRGCTQGSMSEYVEDILNRAKDIIVSTRKYCGGAASAGLLPGGPDDQSAYATAPGTQQPTICGTGGLAEPVGPGTMGKYLKEMAPQYQKMFARVLSPEDQTTLTLLTTVGTLLDTIEDTGLTRMDPVQLCSDKTLRELADVGEKMLFGLKEHLIKVRTTPPENLTSSDPFMAQITREAYEALEIGAESLEVAVGLLRDVTNLCGELSEHPELLQQCAVDLEAARKKNEDQYKNIASKQEEACKLAASQQGDGLNSTNPDSDTTQDDANAAKGNESAVDVDGATQDAAVAEDGNPNADGTTGDGDPAATNQDEKSITAGTQDEATGNDSASTQDAALSATGQEADEVGNQGITPEIVTGNTDQQGDGAAGQDGRSDGDTGKDGQTGVGNNATAKADGVVDSNNQKDSTNKDAAAASVAGNSNSQKDAASKDAPAGKSGPASAPAGAATSSNNKNASGRGSSPGDSGMMEMTRKAPAGMSLAVSNQAQSMMSTQTSGGRIVFITVSFVVGMVVGYVFARSVGLGGLNVRSITSFFSQRFSGCSCDSSPCNTYFSTTDSSCGCP